MIQSILHPSDLSLGNEAAFLHALRLAVAAKSSLCILHSQSSGNAEDTDWSSVPGVRSALIRWGLLGTDAPRSAVANELGVRIEKIEMHGTPVQAVLHWLDENFCDLIVMATHAREGLDRMLRGSVAEDLARHAQLPTLFLPLDVPGFVDKDSGRASIRNVLIPIDHKPHPGPAVSSAFELVDAYGCGDAILHLLHVGRTEDAPLLNVEPNEERRIRRHARTGDVTDEILAAVREVEAQLVVMATEGRHGFLDAVRGSTTVRVMREAGCPVLAVPAG
jgi:nucleotide-binding universal stress UspA family protein